jgi:phosphate-selective porin OprO/OprP
VTGLSEQVGGFGRATFQVFQDPNYSLHIGVNALFLFKPPVNDTTGARTLTLSDRPELRIDPTSILNTGASANVAHAQVYSGEVAGGYGPLYFQGEYFWYNVDRLNALSSLRFQGGYAEASWTITGESRAYNPSTGAYNGIVPNNPIVPGGGGGWGAWEIAARYSIMDLNDRLGFADGVSGGKQQVYTVGLNWYVNRNIRFMFNYLHGTIDKQRSPTDITDAGVRFDAIAMRTQVAF